MKKRLQFTALILIITLFSTTAIFASNGVPPKEGTSAPIEIPYCETECDC